MKKKMPNPTCVIQNKEKRCPSLPVVYKNKENDAHLYLWYTKKRKRCPSLPVIYKIKKMMPNPTCGIQKKENDAQPYLWFTKIRK